MDTPHDLRRLPARLALCPVRVKVARCPVVAEGSQGRSEQSDRMFFRSRLQFRSRAGRAMQQRPSSGSGARWTRADRHSQPSPEQRNLHVDKTPGTNSSHLACPRPPISIALGLTNRPCRCWRRGSGCPRLPTAPPSTQARASKQDYRDHRGGSRPHGAGWLFVDATLIATCGF